MVERHWDKVAGAYQILVDTATERSKVHYGYIGDQLGASAIAVDGLYLVPIYRYCRANDLPNLVSLVVKKGTDDPGLGWASQQTLKSERAGVYAFNWENQPRPTAEDLASFSTQEDNMPASQPAFMTPEEMQHFVDQELPVKATYQNLLNTGGTYRSDEGKVVVPTEDGDTFVRYAPESTEVSGPPVATSWWVMESYFRTT